VGAGICGECGPFNGAHLHRRAPIEDSLLKHHWRSDHLFCHFFHPSGQNLVGVGRRPKCRCGCCRTALCATQRPDGLPTVPPGSVPSGCSLNGKLTALHLFSVLTLFLQTYRCMASNSFGTIRSRDCKVRAGKCLILLLSLCPIEPINGSKLLSPEQAI